MTENSYCVFCKEDNKSKIIFFDIDKLKKSLEILHIRKENSLKYCDVVLPSNVSQTEGYHSGCYSKFLSLNPKYKRDNKCSQPLTEFVNETLQDSFSKITCEPVLSVSPLCNLSADSNETCYDSIEELEIIEIDTQNEIACNKNLEDVCFFCGKQRIKNGNRCVKNLNNLNSQQVLDSVQNKANELLDLQMQNKLNVLKANKATVKYHTNCKTLYLRRNKSSSEKTSKWHDKRDFHNKAFAKVCFFIENNVIKKKHGCTMDMLQSLYKDHFKHGDKESNILSSNRYTQILEQKLQNKFKSKIRIIVSESTKMVKPIRGTVSSFLNLEDVSHIKKVALELRREILKLHVRELPQNITAEEIIKGECDLPVKIRYFYTILFSGDSNRRAKSSITQRYVRSVSQDAVHIVSNGKIKTSKHLTLAHYVKNTSGNKEVVSVLNRYGHCISYTGVQAIETEAAFSCTNETDVTPSTIERSPGLGIGVAWDNFDLYVETLNGKNTMHDCFGIAYQNETPTENNAETKYFNSDFYFNPENSENVTIIANRKLTVKRRRNFNLEQKELKDYNKRTKIIENLLPLNSPLRKTLPDGVNDFYNVKYTWVFSHLFEIPYTPMIVGFFSLIYKDISPKQRVAYLTPINDSPTKKSVVVETMDRSLKIADECGENYIPVTYDLQIYKEALRIQSIEKPKFDRIFLLMGPFHIKLNYFRAVGKFIDNCGLSNILIESNLLAAGSLNGLITGKHYNRCKKIHSVVSLVLQELHLQEFLSVKQIEFDEDLIEYLKSYTQQQSTQPKVEHKRLLIILQQYTHFCNETLTGVHGKTAQFYFMYIKFIDYYVILDTSVRMRNLEMFKNILPKMANLFFIFNQPNYSRYLVKFHDNLLKIDQTHPGLKQIFQNGAFGVRRTDKPFSAQDVDLTLEQTNNADAASASSGLIHLTNLFSSRCKWTVTQGFKSEINSHVLRDTGLSKQQDITEDLYKHRVKKFHQLANAFENILLKHINPFSSALDKDLLLNISSGKAAPIAVADFLLNAEVNGNNQKELFISQCAERKERFEEPIARNKLLTFTETLPKKKVKVAGKVKEIRMQRDLFGKLLSISLEQKVDIEKALSYPITPVPLSLSHIDGSMCKTEKSVLLEMLEKKIESDQPTSVDYYVIDAMFYLHRMINIPETFGALSKKLLQMVVNNNAPNIALIFDQYFNPSIKDHEHLLRGSSENREYLISGSNQKCPTDFRNELRNSNFKKSLIRFIINDWNDEVAAKIINNKVLHVSYDFHYKFQVINNTVDKTLLPNFSCEGHEEADTKISFFISKLDVQGNILIKANDTDILIILLGNMTKFDPRLNIWMEVGVGNKVRVIDVSKLYKNIGTTLCEALPAFHAFTGCDFNASFYRKGKKAPLKILESTIKYQKVFTELASLNSSNKDRVFKEIEEFVCRLYGCKKVNNVNQARFALFMKAYGIKKNEKYFSLSNKNFDASSLPPCQSELYQHILRTSYISNIWQNIDKQNSTNLKAIDNGWDEVNGKYVCKWFDGDQIPPLIDDVIISLPDDDSEDDVTLQNVEDDDHSDYEFDIENREDCSFE